MNYFFILCSFIVGILFRSIFRTNFSHVSLQDWANYSQLAIAFFALIALWNLIISFRSARNQREKDTNDQIFSLVRLFRSEVIDGYGKINKLIIAKGERIDFTVLKDFTIGSLKTLSATDKTKLLNAKRIFDLSEINADANNAINTIEEFANQVILTNISDHPAFETLKRPYIEMVSIYSSLIIFHKNVLENGFKNTIELYQKWLQDYTYLPGDEIKKRIINVSEALK